MGKFPVEMVLGGALILIVFLFFTASTVNQTKHISGFNRTSDLNPWEECLAYKNTVVRAVELQGKFVFSHDGTLVNRGLNYECVVSVRYR